MKLARLVIQNFRCLREVEIPLDDVTVLIGENNTGKSAVLEALQVCLRRSPGPRRSAPVQEYDFYMADRDADPRASPGITIQADFTERQPDEWPEAVVQTLANILQPEPDSDLNHIRVRFTCRFEPELRDYAADWEFLNLEGQAIRPPGGPADKLRLLHRHAPVHYLSALRDAAEQFSSRSGLWAPLLRSLEIPAEQRQELEASLDGLNSRLLTADPRLGRVTGTLEHVDRVMAESGGQCVSVRALPFKIWDLMSRAQVVIRSGDQGAELPLGHHGQGVQSLSVLLLFRAYIENYLETQEAGTVEPILALEEPEAHLHPQAARALWDEIRSLPGQTLVATHSPYFVQHVPFRNLRVLRRTRQGTQVFWLRTRFTTVVAAGCDGLERFCKGRDFLEYDTASGRLTTTARIDEDDYRKLLRAMPKEAQRIKSLREEAAAHVSDEEIAKIESAARRVRGEILFARAWILCEGETDLLLLYRFAEMLGQPLDRHGVSVIDWGTGTGEPAGFAALARALGFSWWVLCDGDSAGDNYIRSVRNRGFADDEIARRIVQLPGVDLEDYLIGHGFSGELTEVARTLGFRSSQPPSGSCLYKRELAEFIKAEHKTAAARLLCDRLRAQGAGAECVPALLAGLIEKAVKADGP